MGLLDNILNTTLPSNSVAANTTGYITGSSTFGSIITLIPLVIITAIIMMVIIAMLTNWNNYKKMSGIKGWLVRTFGSFLYGLLTLILFGVPVTVIYEIYNAASNNLAGTSNALLWLGGIVGGFFVLAGIGYVMNKLFYKKIGANMARAKAEKEKKEKEEARKHPPEKAGTPTHIKQGA